MKVQKYKELCVTYMSEDEGLMAWLQERIAPETSIADMEIGVACPTSNNFDENLAITNIRNRNVL